MKLLDKECGTPRPTWTIALFCLSIIAVATLTTNSWAQQLEFTEIMNNTLDPEEADWEWVEIRNNSASAIDLDGYVFYDESNHSPLLVPNISAALSPTTVIPANGVAVLYNGRNLGNDGARFSSAWNLSPSVPLISVQGQVPALNNSGDRIALWSSLSDYTMDIADPDMSGNSAMIDDPTFEKALLDFRTGFPVGNGLSMQWRGTGSNADALEWASSESGVNGAYQSTMTVTLGDLVGVGNPGVVPGGTAPAEKLLITEIMYDPAAPEAANEWVEVYNNTGEAIDFSLDPHTIFDHDTSDLLTENITSGVIPQGGTAILYSDDIDPADFEAAWGAGNHIPVSDFFQGSSGLANGGDQFGIYKLFEDYEIDAMTNSFDLADATVAYDDDPATGWLNNNGQSSIWLATLDSDPTMGINWNLSDAGDGISFTATLDLEDHSGEDVGSPGVFNPTTGGSDCDFDGSGACDISDLDLMYAELGGSNATFDLDSDGDVDNDDVTQWLADASTVDPMGRTFKRGDGDLNGAVEGSDFTTLALNFGDVGGWGAGNFVVDAVAGGGDVGGPDFTQLALNFGFTSVSAVPEPGALSLLLTLGLALFGWNRTRRLSRQEIKK